MKNVIFAGLLVIASGALVFAGGTTVPGHQVGEPGFDDSDSGTTAHGGADTSDVQDGTPPEPAQDQDEKTGFSLTGFAGEGPDDGTNSGGSDDDDFIHTGPTGSGSTGQGDDDHDANVMQSSSFNG